MATTKAKRRKPAPRSKLSAFGKAVKEDGRTAAWLAERTGYSVAHIWRVARGEHPGSTRFHAVMQTVMGRTY